MPIRFLLGPAGAGKTWRCLEEARRELMADPEGPPLIFLAPKQATFQLERQLLATGDLAGFTRLHIFSFERLARWLLERSPRGVPELLGEQGRTMVLRALLHHRREELSIFRKSAGRAGFAQELSDQLRELANHGLSADDLLRMAGRAATAAGLPDKLRDLAAMQGWYRDWLRQRALNDADALLSAGADAARQWRLAAGSAPPVAALWLDGFAQLTPQECDLLAEVAACAERATLAFCMDRVAGPDRPLSPARLVSHTYGRVRNALAALDAEGTPEVHWLDRDPLYGRFARAPALFHLEKHWGQPGPWGGPAAEQIELIECRDAEEEAIHCARAIRRHAQAGGRFREVAVLLRGLESSHADLLRRTFLRYEIPFFLDHRESVAHHPLAELTRGVLRSLAFDFRLADLFTSLKSGLSPLPREELDLLENEALARGWEGQAWRQGFRIRDDAALETRMNDGRQRAVGPMLRLQAALGRTPDGEALADGLRGFWQGWRVEEQLAEWSAAGEPMHQTVWEQMSDWAANIALAFPGQPLPLATWLPILEAGLGSLTVGVIPPVLDQVLIGAVDRSRNPDLKHLFLLGMNEGLFPAPPSRPALLTEADRERLAEQGCELAHLPVLQLAREEFYGYIACTRARERLTLTCAQADARGRPLNASRFIDHILRLFPGLAPQPADLPAAAASVFHRSELARIPGLAERSDAAMAIRPVEAKPLLPPEVAERLYGNPLRTSVSQLEKFAACPFQFFVAQGLRTEERRYFELDVREQGSFQHEVLAQFHLELAGEGKRWRDVSAAEARARIACIAETQFESFGDGLLLASDRNRFTAESFKLSLQDFMQAVIEWFATNAFDPAFVELPFGFEGAEAGWCLDLDAGRSLLLRGKIDRIDVWRDGDRAYCLVLDYKSGGKRPDRLFIEHGIQQQLPAYLLAVLEMPGLARRLGAAELLPAGIFFVPLAIRNESAGSRSECLEPAAEARRSALQHLGLCDLAILPRLDSSVPGGHSRQFNHWLKKDGEPDKRSFATLPTEDFRALLAQTRATMRELGRRVLAGDVSIDPYRKGRVTACARCDFASVCRFDSWEQRFRELSAPRKAGGGDS